MLGVGGRRAFCVEDFWCGSCNRCRPDGEPAGLLAELQKLCVIIFLKVSDSPLDGLFHVLLLTLSTYSARPAFLGGLTGVR